VCRLLQGASGRLYSCLLEGIVSTVLTHLADGRPNCTPEPANTPCQVSGPTQDRGGGGANEGGLQAEADRSFITRGKRTLGATARLCHSLMGGGYRYSCCSNAEHANTTALGTAWVLHIIIPIVLMLHYMHMAEYRKVPRRIIRTRQALGAI